MELKEECKKLSNLITEEYITERDRKIIEKKLTATDTIMFFRYVGKYTINRLDAGAGAKPEYIREKSIKDAVRLEKSNPGFPFDKLAGFVGRWENWENNDNIIGKLLGIYLTKYGYRQMELKGYRKQIDKGVGDYHYLKLGNNIDEYNPDNLCETELGEDWQRYFFTGDYDIPDIFQNMKRKSFKASEISKCIKEINCDIIKEQIKEIVTNEEEQKDYRRIQHGSHIPYWACVIKEVYSPISKNISFPLDLTKWCNSNKSHFGLSVAYFYEKEWHTIKNITEYFDFLKAHNIEFNCIWSSETELNAEFRKFEEKEKKIGLSIETAG